MKSKGGARLLILVSFVAAVVFAAPSAPAQEDPYGSTTTTSTPDDRDPRCTTQADTTVTAGSEGRITLHDVLEGDTIEIFMIREGSGEARPVATVVVTGDEQAAGLAPEGEVTGLSSGGAVLLGAPAAPGDNVESFPVDFTIPADLRPGRYNVEGVAPTYTCECNKAFVVQRAGAGGGGGGSEGGLAFTGADVLMMVLVGLALVAVGVYLRRRFTERRAHAG